jgi:hypothetical protein
MRLPKGIKEAASTRLRNFQFAPECGTVDTGSR